LADGPQTLGALGWSPESATAFAPYAASNWHPARVAAEHRGRFQIWSEDGVRDAVVTGRLRHDAQSLTTWPAVGDWVAYEPSEGSAGPSALLHAVLPRRSQFVRRAAGPELRPQVVAANVDTVFITVALLGDFSVRRIERYVALGWESGAVPVILLTKTDLVPDAVSLEAEARACAPGVDVLRTSAVQSEGVREVRERIVAGTTAAFLGSSGAGKSTLINALAGAELMRTADVRASDARGRHTTRHRQLILLPGGGLVIDTPGMRELQLWNAADGLDRAFDDLQAFAQGCRFADCAHEHEPECAVRAAVERGDLPADRLDSWHKLRRELAWLERERDPLKREEHQRKIRQIHRSFRGFEKGSR
jgi:ribosome biogenesis GTPase